jgi:hypothetical protein
LEGVVRRERELKEEGKSKIEGGHQQQAAAGGKR